jgi:hypothetical protein
MKAAEDTMESLKIEKIDLQGQVTELKEENAKL